MCVGAHGVGWDNWGAVRGAVDEGGGVADIGILELDPHLVAPDKHALPFVPLIIICDENNV